jgi:hypothetical protein
MLESFLPRANFGYEKKEKVERHHHSRIQLATPSIDTPLLYITTACTMIADFRGWQPATGNSKPARASRNTRRRMADRLGISLSVMEM